MVGQTLCESYEGYTSPQSKSELVESAAGSGSTPGKRRQVHAATVPRFETISSSGYVNEPYEKNGRARYEI